MEQRIAEKNRENNAAPRADRRISALLKWGEYRNRETLKQ